MLEKNYLVVTSQARKKITVPKPRQYRESIHIIKDIITLLSRYGQLNQTALLSYSGLNLQKHKHLLIELESCGFIIRTPTKEGKRTIAMYKVTIKGMDFCKKIIAPYEELFPR